MEITPDEIVYWQWGWVVLNATILYTWVVMAFLVVTSWIVTRNLSAETDFSKGQNLLEIVVDFLHSQIRELTQEDPSPYLPFIGTLFLLISISNLGAVVPGFSPPTASLSTTAALAVCVFFAVPAYGIVKQGWADYFRRYIQPTPLMLPFHVIGEVSRTLALAIRLFGNIMSGSLAVAILVTLAPLFFPVLIQALGLIIGQVQAYIFAVLATVYIASGVRMDRSGPDRGPSAVASTDPPVSQ